MKMTTDQVIISTITTCNKNICSISWDEGYDEHDLRQIYFGVGIVTQFIIAFVGLIGNALSALIFTSRELRSTFHMLLVVLAFFDSAPQNSLNSLMEKI